MSPPAINSSDTRGLTLDTRTRQAIFYMKTDIALPNHRLRGLQKEAATELQARIPAVAQLAEEHDFAGTVAPLAAGSFHVVHKIERADATAAVMRSTLYGLFDIDRSLNLERRVAVWLGAKGHLVPATLASGIRDGGAPFDFALLEMARGAPLRDLGDATLDENPRLLASVGASLRLIHETSASGAGLLDLERECAVPTGVGLRWADYVPLRLDEHIRECVEAGYVDTPLESRIRSLFEVMLPTLGDRPMRLLHGDPGTHNICVDPATSAVTAWLDWEDALVGDPLFDLALLSSFQPPRRMPAAFEGYGLEDKNFDEKRLIAFYFLRIALSKTAHRIRFGIKDGPGRTPGHHRIYRGVDDLERLL